MPKVGQGPHVRRIMPQSDEGWLNRVTMARQDDEFLQLRQRGQPAGGPGKFHLGFVDVLQRREGKRTMADVVMVAACPKAERIQAHPLVKGNNLCVLVASKLSGYKAQQGTFARSGGTENQGMAQGRRNGD